MSSNLDLSNRACELVDILEVDGKSSCDSCGKTDVKLFLCPCGEVSYCGKECQKIHWQLHKVLCSRKVVTKPSQAGFTSSKIKPNGGRKMVQPRLQESPWTATDIENQKLLSEKLQMELIMEEEAEKQQRQASKVEKKSNSKQTLKKLKQTKITKHETTKSYRSEGQQTKTLQDSEESIPLQDSMNPIQSPYHSNGPQKSCGGDADIAAQAGKQAAMSGQPENPIVSQAEADDAHVEEDMSAAVKDLATAEGPAERSESPQSTGTSARRRAYRPRTAQGQDTAAAATAGRNDAPEVSEAAALAEPIAMGEEPNSADADDRLPPSHPLASVLRDCDTSSPAGYGGGHYEILSGTHTPGAPTSCYHVGGGGSSGASIPMFCPGSMSEWAGPRWDPAQGPGRYPPRGFGPPWLASSNFGPWPGLARTACPPPLGAVHPAAADAAVAACTPWPGPGYLADPYGAGPAMWLPVHLFLPPPLHGPSG